MRAAQIRKHVDRLRRDLEGNEIAGEQGVQESIAAVCDAAELAALLDEAAEYETLTIEHRQHRAIPWSVELIHLSPALGETLRESVVNALGAAE